jgi:hypothetical protein
LNHDRKRSFSNILGNDHIGVGSEVWFCVDECNVNDVVGAIDIENQDDSGTSDLVVERMHETQVSTPHR